MGVFRASRILSFLRDDSGQATTEYIVLLAAIVIGASAMARQILQTLEQGVLRLGGQLERDLKTGKAPLGIWTN